ncbi:bacillithiol biosynthesis cysteine-adding enzyme BshC [Gangjinia marincola]|uniref:Putative cysteine ligase BshC n=1 Tax=Gangjinia marincola TaxID=578463 RepID=A0ABN1MG59_9FLAO
MPITLLPYQELTYFSSLIKDYLLEKGEVQDLYHRFPHLNQFQAQINEKTTQYSADTRDILSVRLMKQYDKIKTSGATREKILQLKKGNTFTITTGHQLNLFTGPLYFLYKIISTINLCDQLKTHYPEYEFVPVYWMATEDHDFEEINYFNLNGKKFRWNKDATGAVGRLSTEGLAEVLDLFKAEVGTTPFAEKLTELFEDAYLKHTTLTEATRYLANKLFGAYGLVIVDGDDAELKRLFVPYIKEELLEQSAHKTVSKSAAQLDEKGYNVQVNPREINLFYLIDGLRERIEKIENRFIVVDHDMQWTQEQILQEVEEHPERFSPNVILRPLYQEVILPNLCYIGGGGELAYWLELKAYFESQQIIFPMLLLRNSALVVSGKQQKKLDKLNLEIKDTFLRQHELINKKVRQISNIDIDFSDQKEHLRQQFEALYDLAKKTDASFVGAVKAQEVKQLNGLDHLEKRLLTAQKRKLKDQVNRMVEIQRELFPNQNLQERVVNFSELYLEYAEDLILKLKENLQPLNTAFTVLNLR